MMRTSRWFMIIVLLVAGMAFGQNSAISTTSTIQEQLTIVDSGGDAVALGAGGDGGDAAAGATSNQVLNFDAPEIRTPIPGNPYWISPMHVPYPKGPSVFGPMTNEIGIGAIRWTPDDMALMKQVSKELGCKGILSAIGEVVGHALTGKKGLRARGFEISNTLLASKGRPKNKNGEPKPVIIICSNLKPLLVELSLFRAGYISGGRFSLNPPSSYKGVLIDEQMVMGLCMNALWNSRPDLIIYYVESAPVAKSKSSYLGLGISSNDKNVGATVGVGKVNAESRVDSRLATAIRGYVYDPDAAEAERDVIDFVNQIIVAKAGDNLSPEGAFDSLLKVPGQTEQRYIEEATPPPSRQDGKATQIADPSEVQKAAKQAEENRKKMEKARLAAAQKFQEAARIRAWGRSIAGRL